MTENTIEWKKILNTTVIVAALGYFVDVYDLVLFLVVGKKSLLDIGVSPEKHISEFQSLLNIQMIGMLIGGLFWGIMGDKKGRLSVLFGSIIMYSVANVLNGMLMPISSLTGIEPLTVYYVLRFMAGVGLAGELGAGITLVSEILDKKSRGIGTMLVASIGVVGAVVAGLVGKTNWGWEVAYYIGGGLGLSLLLLRIGIFESGMFEKLHKSDVHKGSLWMLFKKRSRAFRYLNSILIGISVWFVIGILVGLAPQLAGVLKVKGVIEDAYCVMLCYIGLVFGDIASGMFSQLLKSRKKVFYIFFIFNFVLIMVYLSVPGLSAFAFYTLILLLGFSVGYWAIFVTQASEQFGTNLRATVTTTVPNFVRGSLALITILFKAIAADQGIVTAAYIVTVITTALSLFAVWNLPETFGKDLDYVEE